MAHKVRFAALDVAESRSIPEFSASRPAGRGDAPQRERSPWKLAAVVLAAALVMTLGYEIGLTGRLDFWNATLHFDLRDAATGNPAWGVVVSVYGSTNQPAGRCISQDGSCRIDVTRGYYHATAVSSNYSLTTLDVSPQFTLYPLTVTPSFNTVIQPGSMASPIAYVVFTDSVSVFSKNGTTGAIDYSGANATTIIQSTITKVISNNVDNVVGSGEVDFAPGTYTVGALTAIAGSNYVTGLVLHGASGAYGATIFKYNGVAGGTMLFLSGCRFCRVENIQFLGNANSAVGISIQYQVANNKPSYEDVIQDSFIGVGGSGTDVLLGASNNLQVSEITLSQVVMVGSGGTTGLDIEGQNTLNIRGYGLKFDTNSIGVKINGGNLVAYDTLFLNSAAQDISFVSGERATAFYGGDSEGSAQHLSITSFGSNIVFYESDFLLAGNALFRNMVNDQSLAYVTFERVDFTNMAFITLGGYNPKPAGSGFGIKRFVDCEFGLSPGQNNNTVLASGVFQVGTNGNILIYWEGNPLGLANTHEFKTHVNSNYLTPFSNGDSASPTASTAYLVQGSPVFITSTGGTNVSITIKDSLGNTVLSGLATLTAQYVPVGYTVNWGAFSVAPTVTPWFT